MKGISIIVGKLNSNYKPLIVAVFLVIGALAYAFYHPVKTGGIEVQGFLGGSPQPPGLLGVARGAQLTDSALAETPVIAPAHASLRDYSLGALAFNDGTIQDPGQPIGPDFGSPSAAIQYIVKRGDTISGVAAHFNITINQLKAANPGIKKSLKIGATLTIPGSATNTQETTSSLPNFNSSFIAPTQGYNYGTLDQNNGVLIANSCGTPVVAAAAGIVVPDQHNPAIPGAWNGGYGDFVLIQHSFGGVYTRYAHLEQVLVKIGDYVEQGQQIGLMGQTGGVSSCELGFEVIGAVNPLGK